MTLTQLRYLVAIADSGLNITQAAERVHATQPGLSKQLKQLEDELGFQLFLRKGRSLEGVAPAGATPSRLRPLRRNSWKPSSSSSCLSCLDSPGWVACTRSAAWVMLNPESAIATR